VDLCLQREGEPLEWLLWQAQPSWKANFLSSLWYGNRFNADVEFVGWVSKSKGRSLEWRPHVKLTPRNTRRVKIPANHMQASLSISRTTSNALKLRRDLGKSQASRITIIKRISYFVSWRGRTLDCVLHPFCPTSHPCHYEHGLEINNNISSLTSPRLYPCFQY
jgi:hypothetical protein